MYFLQTKFVATLQKHSRVKEDNDCFCPLERYLTLGMV